MSRANRPLRLAYGRVNQETNCLVPQTTTWADFERVHLLEGAELARARNLGDTWIGLSDQAAEGQWVWTDGNAPAYTHWDQGEPNDGGRNGEDCALIMTAENRTSEWDDRPCEGSRPFVC